MTISVVTEMARNAVLAFVNAGFRAEDSTSWKQRHIAFSKRENAPDATKVLIESLPKNAVIVNGVLTVPEGTFGSVERYNGVEVRAVSSFESALNAKIYRIDVCYSE